MARIPQAAAPTHAPMANHQSPTEKATDSTQATAKGQYLVQQEDKAQQEEQWQAQHNHLHQHTHSSRTFGSRGAEGSVGSVPRPTAPMAREGAVSRMPQAAGPAAAPWQPGGSGGSAGSAAQSAAPAAAPWHQGSRRISRKRTTTNCTSASKTSRSSKGQQLHLWQGEQEDLQKGQ